VSFDLAVWEADHPLSAAEAANTFNALCEGEFEFAPTSARIVSFLQEVNERWPDGNDDNGPWASWPLESGLTPSGLVVNIVFSRADEVLTSFIQLAAKHGLVLYDPRTASRINPLPNAAPILSSAA